MPDSSIASPARRERHGRGERSSRVGLGRSGLGAEFEPEPLKLESKFENFRDAFGFVARVALVAEAEGHPDIELGVDALPSS